MHGLHLLDVGPFRLSGFWTAPGSSVYLSTVGEGDSWAVDDEYLGEW